VASSGSDRARTRACYRLALFHDNNGRDRETILDYERALRLALGRKLKSEAWRGWRAASKRPASRAGRYTG